MKHILYLLFFAIGLTSCGLDPVARPNGYMRIGLPNLDYTTLNLQGCAFKSSINQAAKVLYKDSANCWIDLVYPSIRSTIQLTYKPVEDNLEELFRDAQKLAYKHTVKASGMREQFFEYDSTKVFGMYYEMSGASAATTQFYATDSTNHFLRGVLYHYSSPNSDSLAPVTAFMREEMLELIANLSWNE
ncbi:MAG TPA: gliding motility lipoprotein GldD [Cryomorphaceae bacterium]|nr:gliding motility lipoprotein GldD [Cryomorphaceae bacterium]|tara:strand:+ start:519 stop:1082 length:564 start_codon:yes stop_codon:yes gene_type:complete